MKLSWGDESDLDGPPIKSVWERIVETRAYSHQNAIVTAVAALLCAVASIWVDGMRYGVLAFGLLSAHCWTAYHLLGRVADLQAALDMRRTMRRPQPTTHLAAGDTLRLEGSYDITVNRAVSLELVQR